MSTITTRIAASDRTHSKFSPNFPTALGHGEGAWTAPRCTVIRVRDGHRGNKPGVAATSLYMSLHHTEFDTIVIGGGQAGPSLASKLDARGEKVAVFQEGPFGGTCLNDGCRPTKALRASAHAAHAARTGAPYGVHVEGVTVNVAEAVERKDAIIGALARRRDGLLREPRDHQLRHRAGSADGKDGDHYLVTFGDTTVTRASHHPQPRRALGPSAHRGPRHRRLPGPPHAAGPQGGARAPHRHRRLLHRPRAGPGVVALRLPRDDPRARRARHLSRGPRHVRCRRGDAARRGSGRAHGRGHRARRARRATAPWWSWPAASASQCDRILVAAGRIPNSDDLGLDTVGVATDKRGYITTDEHFLTSTPGIYAVGDVNGRGAFTHTSYQDHEILADHLAGGDRSVAGRIPTYALFTDPPLGRVGHDRDPGPRGRAQHHGGQLRDGVGDEGGARRRLARDDAAWSSTPTRTAWWAPPSSACTATRSSSRCRC